MNQEKILVTSSDNIPYSKIIQNLGIVDSQIVVGANLFRDAFAGIRDVFGGQTKGYKKDIDKMKNAAIKSIRNQTENLGANAVIGLRIDLDEVSGGGKSMFMLNVYGTAVTLAEDALKNNTKNEGTDEISIETLKYFRKRNELKKELSKADGVDEQALVAFKKIALDKITEFDLWSEDVSLAVLSSSQTASTVLEDNLKEIPIEHLESFLLKHIHKPLSQYWNKIYESLSDRNWYNYEVLMQLLKKDSHIKRFRALRLVGIEKDYYQKGDIDKLKEISHFLRNDFDTSVETQEVSKMIGNKKVFTCPKCLREREVEKNCECGTNGFGLKPDGMSSEVLANILEEESEALKNAFSVN